MRLLREMLSLEVLSCMNVAIKAFHSVSGLLNTNDTDVTAGFTLLNMTDSQIALALQLIPQAQT